MHLLFWGDCGLSIWPGFSGSSISLCIYLEEYFTLASLWCLPWELFMVFLNQIVIGNSGCNFCSSLSLVFCLLFAPLRSTSFPLLYLLSSVSRIFIFINYRRNIYCLFGALSICCGFEWHTVSGEDRAQFLHNQSTANFECLHEGQVRSGDSRNAYCSLFLLW